MAEHEYTYPTVRPIPQSPFVAEPDDFIAEFEHPLPLSLTPSEKTMTKEDLQVLPLATVGASVGAYKYAIKPFLEEHAAQAMWGATLSCVALYDLWAVKSKHETMSHAFRTANQHPLYKYLCVGSLGGLAVHLMREP